MRWVVLSVFNAVMVAGLSFCAIAFVSPWLAIPCSIVMIPMFGSCWMTWDGRKYG